MMSERTPYGIIYMTSRVFRGEVVKRYIGQHKLMHNQRDDYYIGSGKILAKAIRKYGRASFVRETLETCYSAEELFLAEEKWVDFYNAVERSDFYNIAKGGVATAEKFRKPIFQYSVSGDFICEYPSREEVSRLLGASSGALSEVCDSMNRTCVGFRWTSIKHERLPELRNKRVQPVLCYSLNGEFIKRFSNTTEANEFAYGANKSNILACCKGRYATAGGYVWRYADD